MAVIRYQPTVVNEQKNPSNPYFYVDLEQGSPEFATLQAACRATFRAQPPYKEQDKQTFTPNYMNVMALQATGFDWELEAAKTALNILAGVIREATYTQIVEPPQRMF